MAGAWNSEYFDKASRVENPAVPQATPPPMYNVSRVDEGTGKGRVILSVILRLLTFLCALIALAILAANKGSYILTDEDGISQQLVTIKFTVMSAFKFLFSACAIVAVYSLAHMIHSLVFLCLSKGFASNIVVAWATFLCDQALAYLLISAGAAGANSALTSRSTGENISGRNDISGFKHMTCEELGATGFCAKAEAAVALTFIAFVFLAITCVFSARRLFKLY